MSHPKRSHAKFERTTIRESRRGKSVILRRFVTGQALAEPTFKELLRLRSRDALATAGQFAVEVAIKEAKQDVIAASEWIDKAHSTFGKLIGQAANPEASPLLDEYSGLALINLAQLPNLATILGQRRLPSPDVAGRVYSTSVTINQQMSDALKTKHSGKMIGLVAETSSLLLAQRYAIANHPDRSWFPFRARLSEDHHDWGEHSHGNAWDISVLTDLTGKPEVSYRVQVKASGYSHHKNSIDYDEDLITVLHVNPDLSLPRDQGTTTEIAAELHRELHGDQLVSGRLDQRTEQLLDVLG